MSPTSLTRSNTCGFHLNKTCTNANDPALVHFLIMDESPKWTPVVGDETVDFSCVKRGSIIELQQTSQKYKVNKMTQCCFPKIYRRGDFSFIKNSAEKETLTHDFKAIDSLGEEGWSLLRCTDFSNTFRDGHCHTKINSNRAFSFTETSVDTIRKSQAWDIILAQNEKVLKAIKIPTFKDFSANVWDTPAGEQWFRVCMNIHPGHTEKTYNRNIRNLSIIANYGWPFFVEKYPVF